MERQKSADWCFENLTEVGSGLVSAAVMSFYETNKIWLTCRRSRHHAVCEASVCVYIHEDHLTETVGP